MRCGQNRSIQRRSANSPVYGGAQHDPKIDPFLSFDNPNRKPLPFSDHLVGYVMLKHFFQPGKCLPAENDCAAAVASRRLKDVVYFSVAVNGYVKLRLYGLGRHTCSSEYRFGSL